MATELVFETHSWSDDNEHGVASGWKHSRLSERGRRLATELGLRRRADGIAVVLSSDLRRAVETAEIALGASGLAVLLDWRLRECDYGDLNGATSATLENTRSAHLDEPYPGGESWRQAVDRAGRVLKDLPQRWDGRRLLVIGHVATRWALDHYIDGVPLDE